MQVRPAGAMLECLRPSTPTILINREPVRTVTGSRCDIELLGEADVVCSLLADRMGLSLALADAELPTPLAVSELRRAAKRPRAADPVEDPDASSIEDENPASLDPVTSPTEDSDALELSADVLLRPPDAVPERRQSARIAARPAPPPMSLADRLRSCTAKLREALRAAREEVSNMACVPKSSNSSIVVEPGSDELAYRTVIRLATAP